MIVVYVAKTLKDLETHAHKATAGMWLPEARRSAAETVKYATWFLAENIDAEIVVCTLREDVINAISILIRKRVLNASDAQVVLLPANKTVYFTNRGYLALEMGYATFFDIQ